MSGNVRAAADLNTRQSRFVAALLTHTSITAAAQAAGVNEKTGRRWLTQPPVLEAYRSARRQIVEHGTGMMQNLMSHAITAVMRQLRAEAPPMAQLAAARMVLEYSTEAVEHDRGARLEELELLVQERLGVRLSASAAKAKAQQPTPFFRRPGAGSGA